MNAVQGRLTARDRMRLGMGEKKGTPARNPCGHGGPFVMAEPIRQLLQPAIEEKGLPTVAALAGIQSRSLWRVMHEQKVIGLQLADRLITDGLDDPSLWWTTPGLELVTQKGVPL